MIGFEADDKAIERAERALARKLADGNNFDLVRALIDAGKPVSFHIRLSEVTRIGSMYRVRFCGFNDCLHQYLEDTIKPCTNDWTCALRYDFDDWQEAQMVVLIKPVEPCP